MHTASTVTNGIVASCNRASSRLISKHNSNCLHLRSQSSRARGNSAQLGERTQSARMFRGLASVVPSATAARSVETNTDTAWRRLDDAKVWLVSDQRQVAVTSLWGDNDRAFLVFARSMGCNFCQQLARELQKDVLPQLDQKGIKLFLVSMGPPERGLEFAALTGFPAEQLLADPENVTYDRLQLKNSGPIMTFFNPKTPLTLLKRFQQDGLKSTGEALKNWKPWIPTKSGQAYQQGGAFLFKGKKLIWQHYDEATGAHAEPDEILKVALGSHWHATG